MHPAEVSYGDYVSGWLDSSVHDFLSATCPKSANTRYALITCLDSNTRPAEMLHSSPELKALASEGQVVGDGFVVSTQSLLKQSRIFFGFDEVWFFSTKPLDPKPVNASLVGPLRIDQTRMDELGEWLVKNHVSLALGGGEGLNFIVKAPKPARYILAHSLENQFGSGIETGLRTSP